MSDDRKQFGYKDLKHKTIMDLAPGAVEKEAEKHGHDGFMPTSVKVMKDGKQVVRGNGNPTSELKGQRGRIVLFIQTGERVTVLKEVGTSYNGTPIHEVATREGKKFLASKNQLKDLV